MDTCLPKWEFHDAKRPWVRLLETKKVLGTIQSLVTEGADPCSPPPAIFRMKWAGHITDYGRLLTPTFYILSFLLHPDISTYWAE